MNTKTFFDVRNIPMRLALIVVVCASFFLTFYYCAGDLLYAFIIALVVLISGFIVFSKVAQAKEERHLRLQQEEIEKTKQEQVTKAEQLFDKIQHDEIKPEWADILFVLDTLTLRESYKAVLLCHVNFIDLFEISTIKEHFKWNASAAPLIKKNSSPLAVGYVPTVL